MATTTNYGWDTPDDTDLVKDGAAAIRTLGSSVDTTTKALNPSTTEGDIEYRSATANTNTRLGIGTAGQVLTVNSGADAPEWATPAGISSADNFVDANQGTTSTSYTALTTAQSVTLTTGTKVLVLIGCRMYNDDASAGNGARMSYEITGATTVAVNDDWSVGLDKFYGANVQQSASRHFYQTVTAGSNTFTCLFKKYGSGQSFFSNRSITVIDLGS